MSSARTAEAAPARPLRSDASRNRELILAAARELFAERGVEVTMDEIARRAGVGVGTAYRRFGSRDELIGALFEERMLEYLALAEEALAEADPWKALATFLERSAAMQAADRALHDLLVGDATTLGRVARIRQRILPLVERLVERARASGELRADVTALDVPVLGLMLGQVVDFSSDVEPDLWRRYLGLLLDGLRARREAPTALGHAPLVECALDEAMAARRPPRR